MKVIYILSKAERETRHFRVLRIPILCHALLMFKDMCDWHLPSGVKVTQGVYGCLLEIWERCRDKGKGDVVSDVYEKK